MMLPIAVTGAVMVCDKGTTMSPLVASGSASVQICGAYAAMVTDTLPGANVSPFGMCVITKAACSPAPVGNWLNSFANSCIIGKVQSLLEGATLPCEFGGTISIMSAAQATVLIGHTLAELPASVRLEILFSSLDFLEKDEHVQTQLLKNLVKGTTPTQRRVLEEIFSRLTPAQAKEVISGAHTVFSDGDLIYDLIKRSGGYRRDSSHHAVQKDDLGFDLPGAGTILVGRSKNGIDGTHLQFEEHAANYEHQGPAETFGHWSSWAQGGGVPVIGGVFKHGRKQKGLYDLDSDHDQNDPIRIGDTEHPR